METEERSVVALPTRVSKIVLILHLQSLLTFNLSRIQVPNLHHTLSSSLFIQ